MQLPLWAYVLLSSVAIAAIAILVRRLQPGAIPPMTANDALALFRDEHPDAGSATAEFSADLRTAIVLAASGQVAGFVTLIGLRWTTRPVCSGEIESVHTDGPRTIVRLRDFTWPSLSLTWPDADAAREWTARLTGPQGTKHA